MAFFKAHFDYVWRSLRRLGMSIADAEDLAQEVFLIVYRQLGTYDRSRPVKPWLFGIARNVAREHRRRAGTRREHADDEAIGSVAESDPGYRAIENVALVRAALAALEDDELVEIVVLHDLDEVPMKDLALALGIALSTAYDRLERARSALAREVSRIRAEGGR